MMLVLPLRTGARYPSSPQTEGLGMQPTHYCNKLAAPHPFQPMNSYCTLYLVRHGETEWNTQRRIQGQLDSELTPEGVTATKELAQRLKDLHFDAIFSSDLGRAAKTAKILKLDRELQIVTYEALRERTFGPYDGRYGKDHDEELRDLLKQYEALSAEEQFKFKFADTYESDEELMSRFITKLREIAVGYEGKTILVVTHGGNLRTFLTHVGYAPHGSLPPGTFKNAGYVKLRSDGVDFFVDEVEGVKKD